MRILTLGIAAGALLLGTLWSPVVAQSELEIAGGRLFARQCARCHVGNGTGPPLTGPDQGLYVYGTGAELATYIMENMPNDRAPALTSEEALALASYLLGRNGYQLPEDGLTMESAAELSLTR